MRALKHLPQCAVTLRQGGETAKAPRVPEQEDAVLSARGERGVALEHSGQSLSFKGSVFIFAFLLMARWFGSWF